MSLEARLTLLREGGLLNGENEALVRRVPAYFQEQHGIALDEENGAPLITHLCAALQRISNGEAINEMDPEIFDDVKLDPHFDRAWAISRDIQRICPILPEAELKYIALHACVILARV